MAQKIKMEFICDQNWDNMTPTQNGRFCDVCDKNVEDFTKFPLNVVQEKTKNNPSKSCGSFRIEHIDPTIIRPIQAPKAFKYLTFVSTLLFSMTSNQAEAQLRKNVKMERVETRLTELKPEKLNQPQIVSDTTEVQEERCFMPLPKRRKSYYLTKKFPFIKRNKVIIMGRYF
jgi:hypothetical protein